MTDTFARDLFVNSVVRYASDVNNNSPLNAWYETIDGNAQGFRARPVVGGHLALVNIFFSSACAHPVLTILIL